MFSNVFDFRNKLVQLRDSQANHLIILLFISLFALLFSACSSAPAEESSASTEDQAPEPTGAPEPTAPATGPQILFSSYRDGSSEIFGMNVDGSDQRQLTDGDTIKTAYTDWVAANPDSEGTGIIDAITPAWSPDNQQVAFAFVGQIFVMNADGTNIQQLTDSESENMDPIWSPDGRQILFVSNADGDREIYGMNVDGTDLLKLTDNYVADDNPSLSPDGQMIAYYSGFPVVIQLINAGGGDPRSLIEGKDGYGWDPAWSPDGKQMAFVSLRDGDDEIFVVNADGSDLRQVTDNSDKDGEPAWSADGQQLAFTSDRDGDLEIYVMNVDGSVVRQLTDNDVADEAPAWSSIP